MASFLVFIFFIIIAILVFGLSVITSILSTIFGFGKRKGTGASQSQTNSQSSNEKTKDTVKDTGKKREKYFDRNEGEYVDFEEIKDNTNE